MKKTQTTMDNLTCESCGNSFECGAKVGKCWCFEVEVSVEKLDELREEFESCLCQECLIEKNRNVNSSN